MTSDRWQQTTLGEIADDGTSPRAFLRTGPFGSQLHASEYVPEGIPVIMPRDFASGSINSKTVARISPNKAVELAGFRVRTGDVLLARRGEMGRCTRIQSCQDGWLCGTGVLRIRPNSLLDSSFLTYSLRRPATVSWLNDHAVGQTLPSLNVRTVASVPVLLPSIDEQRRIARILSAVELAIANSHGVLDQSRRLRDRFWRQLLTHGPRCYPDPIPGMNPREWQLRPIGSLCSMTNGFPFKAKDRSTTGLPIIRIKNLNGSREFHHFAGMPAPGWTVDTGDLLFAWAGVKGSSFGPCLWPGPRGVLNQHIFLIRPDKEVTKEWLFEAFKLVTRAIEEKARGFKSDLQHVRKSEIVEHLVPVPPFEVQRWIATVSNALTAIEVAERKTLATLERLKTGLSEDLLSGRMRTAGD